MPLEHLDPLAGALDHAEVDAHGVARLELRDLAQLSRSMSWIVVLMAKEGPEGARQS